MSIFVDKIACPAPCDMFPACSTTHIPSDTYTCYQFYEKIFKKSNFPIDRKNFNCELFRNPATDSCAINEDIPRYTVECSTGGLDALGDCSNQETMSQTTELNVVQLIVNMNNFTMDHTKYEDINGIFFH